MTIAPSGVVGPLTGITILDCTVTLPGPYATALLLRLGARVIKLEPKQGDITRMFSHLHDALNAGKESVAVDLKDPSDLALAKAIAARADVFVEGWRPGVAARLGLGPKDLHELNARIIYCSISGYGATSPLRDRPGHDINYLATSGMTRMLFGERAPEPLGVPLADLAGGTFAALRIAAELSGTRRTEGGSTIDASLGGAVRDWVEALGGAQTEHPVAELEALPHYGVFETADGHYLTLGTVHEDHFWKGLCAVLDKPEWIQISFPDRAARTEELGAEIQRIIRQRTRGELEARLASADTCWGFVEAPLGSSPIGGMIPHADGPVPALSEHSKAIREEFSASFSS